MILNLEQQKAVENGEPVASETEQWTIEEMNLLADEAEELISRREETTSGCGTPLSCS